MRGRYRVYAQGFSAGGMPFVGSADGDDYEEMSTVASMYLESYARGSPWMMVTFWGPHKNSGEIVQLWEYSQGSIGEIPAGKL